MSGVDFLPTLSALAQVPLPAAVALDGEDLSAAWKGVPQSRTRPLFWEYGRNTNSFAYAQAANRSPNLAVRDGNWKLLINANGTGAELYDLATDPKEQQNLATAKPEITQRLSAQALAWRKALP